MATNKMRASEATRNAILTAIPGAKIYSYCHIAPASFVVKHKSLSREIYLHFSSEGWRASYYADNGREYARVGTMIPMLTRLAKRLAK